LFFMAKGEQQNPGSIGARAMSLSSASVTLADAWSGFNNCAGLAIIDKGSIAADYGDRFMLKELTTQNVALNIKTPFGTLFSSYAYSGTAGFNEMRAGIGYARTLGPKVAFGVQVLMLPTKFSVAEPTQTVAMCDIGLLLLPNKNLTVGFSVYNPTGSAYNARYTHIKLPRITRTGIGWHNGTILASGDITIDSNAGLSAAIGLEATLLKNWFIRTGYGTLPQNLSAGTGLRVGRFTLDYSVRFITMPGKLSNCSVAYAF